MSFLMAVKVLADLCLYFGIAGGAAPWFGGTDMFLLWPALLCAAGVWLGAMGEKRPALRFAGLLPPLAGLLLADSAVDLVLLAPALIYTCAVLLLGRFDLNREQYQDFFLHSLWAAGVLGLLILTYPTSDRRNLVFFLCLYLLLGFFLLLQLRLSRGGWGSRSLNMLSLLAAIAFGGGLCLAAWLVLQLSGPVWDAVGSAIYYVLSAIVYAVAFLAQFLPSLTPKEPEEVEVPDFGVGSDTLSGRDLTEPNPATEKILTIIAIAVVVAVIAVVMRRMLKTTGKARPAARRMVSTERFDAPPEKRRGPWGSNRERVRRSYRKFMQLLLDRGVALKSSDTTAEIQSSAGFVRDPAPAGQLRELYLTARYDEETEVTGQQAREARELLKALRKDPEFL